jgi:energy-coupling factor transporter ATP-binding protein EcfA2
MKVKYLTMSEFSAFSNVRLEFSPQLNVFIGANATGKTHAMKVLYSLLKACEYRGRPPSSQQVRSKLSEKLASVFHPDEEAVGRLVRRAKGQKKAVVSLKSSKGSIRFSLTRRGITSTSWARLIPAKPSVFVPAQDALAMYEGFVAAYQNRELSFDETYYDLCVALTANPLRGPRTSVRALADSLEEITGGKIELRGGRFYLRSVQGTIEAHLLAEGYRKIAAIERLIVNGSLMKNGFLFWDEPEANLNPQLITKVALTLRHLAREGVQVFVATHDYLLTHELSLAVEYGTRPQVDTRFFAFSRERSGSPVRVQAGSTLAGLDHNPILDEFSAHYERERSLFYGNPTGRREG